MYAMVTRYGEQRVIPLMDLGFMNLGAEAALAADKAAFGGRSGEVRVHNSYVTYEVTGRPGRRVAKQINE